MRKILTSVLGVAGLLAVVLALAASPASAAKKVVKVTTAANVGEYTVSWETNGGCDPGSGTSGATGSLTLTVADPGGGSAVADQSSIVTNDICNYTYTATFTNADGDACVVGTNGSKVEESSGAITLAVDTTKCVKQGKLVVTVKGNYTAATQCDDADITAASSDSSHACAGKAAGDVKVPQDGPDDLDAMAVSATTFTITATPEKDANGKVPEGCEAVSEDTEDDPATSEKLQQATLTVVDKTIDQTDCTYTVTAALPTGFAAGDGDPLSKANSLKAQQPTDAGPDGTSGSNDGDTADDHTAVVDDLKVSVAEATVHLVQNVIGDAGGASASYAYSATDCGVDGLPSALTQNEASGGISTVPAKRVVELRTGRFTISGALPVAAAADDGDSADVNKGDAGTQSNVLNDKARPCHASVTVSDVPAHCSASNNGPINLAELDGDAIIEVTIDCSPPPEPEPMPDPEPEDPPPADDMGGDEGGEMGEGAEDMGGDEGAMDDGGDMGEGAMDDGGDMGEGAMDAGPPEDKPTG